MPVIYLRLSAPVYARYMGYVIINKHKRFFSEWLPTAEYEQANGMNFEIHGGDSDMGYVELWYAVKKKA